MLSIQTYLFDDCLDIRETFYVIEGRYSVEERASRTGFCQNDEFRVAFHLRCILLAGYVDVHAQTRRRTQSKRRSVWEEVQQTCP